MKKNKTKLIFKLIAVVLLQAFLVMDIAWAGQGEFFVSGENPDTLGPKVRISLPALQDIFNASLNSPEQAERLIGESTGKKENQSLSDRSGNRFWSFVRQSIVIGAFLIAFVMPVSFSANFDFGLSPPTAAAASVKKNSPALSKSVKAEITRAQVLQAVLPKIPELPEEFKGLVIETGINKNLEFSNAQAKKRVAQINSWIDNVYDRYLQAGLLDDFITKRGDSAEARQIGKALFLIQIAAPEKFALLKSINPAFYVGNIPGSGMTTGSRMAGIMGRPLIYVHTNYLNSNYQFADIVIHEGVHAARLPRGYWQLPLAYNAFTFFRNWLSDSVPEEKNAYRAEVEFAASFGIKPEKGKTNFINELDLIGPYYHYKWTNVMLCLVGTILFNIVPIVIIGGFIKRIFSKDNNRNNRNSGSGRRGSGGTQSNRYRGNRNRFRSLVFVPLLAMGIAQGMSPANAAAFTEGASPISSLQTGVIHAAKKIPGTEISFVDVEKANNILGYAQEMHAENVDMVSFGEMGRSLAITPELLSNWMNIKNYPARSAHEIGAFIRPGSVPFAVAVNRLSNRIFVLGKETGVMVEDLSKEWNAQLAHFFPDQKPLVGSFMQYRANTDGGLSVLNAKYPVKDGFYLIIDLTEITTKGFFLRSREEMQTEIDNIGRQLKELPVKPAAVFITTQSQGFLPMESEWALGEIEKMMQEVYSATKDMPVAASGTVSSRGKIFALPAIFAFVGTIFSQLLSAGSASAASSAAGAITGTLAGLSVGTLAMVSLIGLLGVILMVDWMRAPARNSQSEEKTLESKEIEVDELFAEENVDEEVVDNQEQLMRNGFNNGELDSVVFIDIDLMRLKNTYIGKKNVNILLAVVESELNKIAEDMGIKNALTLRRGGDEFVLALNAGGDKQNAMRVAGELKKRVENANFAVAEINSEALDETMLDIINSLGGNVDTVGSKRILIVPQETEGKIGKQKILEFIAQVNNIRIKDAKEEGVVLLKVHGSWLSRKAVGNQVSFTLSMGLAYIDEAVDQNVDGSDLYEKTHNLAAFRKDDSKAGFKKLGNGHIEAESVFVKKNLQGESILTSEAAKNLVKNFQDLQERANKAEKQKNFNGVSPVTGPGLKYFSSQDAFREYANEIDNKDGAIVFALQGLGYYDLPDKDGVAKIGQYHQNYYDAPAAVRDNRIDIRDFKVINEAYGYVAGDEAIAILRIAAMQFPKLFEHFELAMDRGPPAGPRGMFIPKTQAARKMNEEEIEALFFEYCKFVKNSFDQNSAVKLGHVRIIWDKFKAGDEPVGMVLERIQQTRTLLEYTYTGDVENGVVLRYKDSVEQAWLDMEEKLAVDAVDDLGRLQAEWQLNEVAEQVQLAEIVSADTEAFRPRSVDFVKNHTANNVSLLETRQSVLGQEGLNIIKKFGANTEDNFYYLISRFKDLLNEGKNFSDEQMAEFEKFRQLIPLLSAQQKLSYAEARKSSAPCEIFNYGALTVIGNDFDARLKANYYAEPVSTAEITLHAHAFIVVNIAGYEFVLDQGLRGVIGMEPGIVLIPAQEIARNQEALWPYFSNNSSVLEFSKKSEEKIMALLALSIDSSVNRGARGERILWRRDFGGMFEDNFARNFNVSWVEISKELHNKLTAAGIKDKKLQGVIVGGIYGLLENAFYYVMERHGPNAVSGTIAEEDAKVGLLVKYDGINLTIEVSDNGTGISRFQLGRIGQEPLPTRGKRDRSDALGFPTGGHGIFLLNQLAMLNNEYSGRMQIDSYYVSRDQKVENNTAVIYFGRQNEISSGQRIQQGTTIRMIIPFTTDNFRNTPEEQILQDQVNSQILEHAI